MDIDMTIFVAAIVENEGGFYDLPYDVFARVASMEGKGVEITPTDDGVNLRIEIVDATAEELVGEVVE